MSSEISIRSSLQVKKGNLSYQSNPSAFTADLSVARGPSPGVKRISIYGTSIDFPELTLPGICRIMNLDESNFVTYGIWEPVSQRFFPLGELLPGDTFILRLSRYLQWELGTGTGTGTVSAETARLHFQANIAECSVLIEAFDAATE